MAEENTQANQSGASNTKRDPSQHVTSREKEQYIIAAKPRSMLQPIVAPFAPQSLEDALKADSRVEYVRAVRLQPGLSGLAMDPFAPLDVHVVRMSPATATEVGQRLGYHAQIERDELLRISSEILVAPDIATPTPFVAALTATTLRVTITVAGKNDALLSDAQVVIIGSRSSTQGVTDRTGQVVLTLPGETGDTIRCIVVTPKAGHWSAWVPSPQLTGGDSFAVVLTPLDQEFSGAAFPGFPGFPSRGITGWGLSATKVDQLQPALQGQGVIVGVVDTGIAARSHQDLKGQIDGGYNVIEQNPDTWDRDDEGHGTHCAGIIAALHTNRGVRGIAPGVKLRSYAVFPGGRFSDLIDALNHCIQDGVDIVNLGLGCDAVSDLVEQKIVQAKQHGVACIVAAGNTSGPVQYPACSPNVLAVAAVGKQGAFPPGTWQTAEAISTDGAAVSADDYFSPAFSCFGPGVSIAAPGVAIVSCFPPNDYAVMDGTSMAASHVTGVGAVVLAHHPDFQGTYRERNWQRVDRLFEILMQGARPLSLGSPAVSLPRSGVGLVDAVRALNVPPALRLPGVGTPPILKPQTWADIVRYLAAGDGSAGQPIGAIRSASVIPTAMADPAARMATRTQSADGVASMVGAVAAAVTESLLIR
jgi:subtilisin family serine protease